LTTEPAANLYLFPFGKELGKENKLYNAKFVRYLRSAPSTDHSQFTFFKGNCRAEMKKHVSYVVDVAVDSNGNIKLAQCECAAGVGPCAHCKHIVCILFSLVKFEETGRVNTEQTCTSKLQTFHHAKPFVGSPVVMSSMNFSKDAEAVQFDPRPEMFRGEKGYADSVKNLSMNFTLYSKKTMPILQLLPPANPYAIAHDHSYSKISLEDSILQSLNIVNISADECLKLERDTRGQHTSPLWTQERQHRLHSSQFGRICKATQRTDMDNLAKSLTERTVVNVASIRHGRTYEKVAVEKYMQKTGNQVQGSGIFVNPDRPYLGSSPDGIVNSTTVLEVKCPYISRDKPITPVSVPFLEDKDGLLCLRDKHDYYFQVQGQLYCSNRQICHFVVFTKVDFVVIEVERNDDFLSHMLYKLDDFFVSHFRQALLNKYLFRNYYKYDFALEHKQAC